MHHYRSLPFILATVTFLVAAPLAATADDSRPAPGGVALEFEDEQRITMLRVTPTPEAEWHCQLLYQGQLKMQGSLWQRGTNESYQASIGCLAGLEWNINGWRAVRTALACRSQLFFVFVGDTLSLTGTASNDDDNQQIVSTTTLAENHLYGTDASASVWLAALASLVQEFLREQGEQI